MLEELKLKSPSKITRTDIASLMAPIGKPGENRTEKMAAVAELNLSNFQGTKLESGLDDYGEF